jgi:hypothetical protein
VKKKYTKLSEGQDVEMQKDQQKKVLECLCLIRLSSSHLKTLCFIKKKASFQDKRVII